MMEELLRTGLAISLAASACVLGTAAHSQPVPAPAAVPISIELNKLEKPEARPGAAAPSDCRVYVVLDNQSNESYEAMQLDLIFFRSDGVIARRLAVDMAPLRPAKKSVKLFDVAGIECGAIGQVLVNDVMTCRQPGGKTLEDCVNLLALSSRTPDVALVK
jgi:hypothetical protein